jgi:hypothetical protein
VSDARFVGDEHIVCLGDTIHPGLTAGATPFRGAHYQDNEDNEQDEQQDGGSRGQLDPTGHKDTSARHQNIFRTYT